MDTQNSVTRGLRNAASAWGGSRTLARLPILTKDGRVYGYQIRYREPAMPGAVGATPHQLRRMSADLACGSLAHDTHVFIDMDEGLVGGPVAVLSDGRTVVEVAASVHATPTLIGSLELLRQCGVSIALDDFQCQENATPLLAYVDYVKVDIKAGSDRLDKIVRRVEPYNLPLIGARVETHAEVAHCWELGFNLFQGNYFAAPDPLRAARIDVGALGLSPLIAAMLDRQSSVGDLNRCWASLQQRLYGSVKKSAELYALGMIRGRLCQALGHFVDGYEPDELYLLGLLSVLDALLDKPMQVLVTELPLTPRLSAALCAAGCSALGRILNQARAYASGDWPAMPPMTADQAIHLSRTYAEAVFDKGAAGERRRDLETA